MTAAIYDGHCVICQQTRRLVQALDWLRRVEFVDIHDWEMVSARWPDLDYETAMGQIHVVAGDGKLLGGYWGVRRLLRDLPLGFPLWLIFHLPGMNWLGTRLYAFIARHRYAINRLFGVELQECANDTCKIPS